MSNYKDGRLKTLEEQTRSTYRIPYFRQGMKAADAGYKGAFHFSISVRTISLNCSCQLGTDFSFWTTEYIKVSDYENVKGLTIVKAPLLKEYMSQSNIATHSELAVWKVETLRMTAILSPESHISEQNWWEDIVGVAPESRSSQPRTGVQKDEGSFAGGRLILTVQPFRIDWLLTADPNLANASFGFPLIGELSESLKSFIKLMNQWFERSPTLQRLAFGATLLLPCKDIQEAYKKLPTFFPLNKLNLENAQDFVYQINRLRNSSSGIPNLSINRLSNWSVAAFTKFQFTTLGTFTSSNTPIDIAIRLELDINTNSDFSDNLPKENLPQIFSELVDLGTEIACEGDIQ